ncbi:hypothetical protein [Pseudotabrizicola algicola]|uniref:Type I secretion protein n=1 Tax=Pseudotabrizicola algicola TaxID=2709381 RepID=A0A6B3RHV9_9RHOB|nr:hypothetical protein [Pseudotabrizicola algicola]NEX45614.1 hypothetical protein [Pseudotabrizicola algicola]
MPTVLPSNAEAFGHLATSAIFGGNVLANRGPMTGDGSYAQAINSLGVTGLRYPGGTLTEDYFDIENPDASEAQHAATGEVVPFIPISHFMSFAEVHGHPVTIVIPTRFMLGDATDRYGNRLPAVDETALRGFINDVASGVYGDAKIAGFEIGNEYWGSGEMNAVEYGRLASEMAVIIDDELKQVAEDYAVDTDAMKVLVQMGHNYGTSNLSAQYAGWSSPDVIADLNERYPDARIALSNIRANGDVNWTEVNNELVIMGFDSEESREAIDGVIAHVYSRGNESSRQYDLNTISRVWMSHEGMRDLEVHVTEWNLKAAKGPEKDIDFGLNQAREMLDLVETFMAQGVSQAHVWPLIQNSANALSRGAVFSEPTPAGEMFSMISKNLIGKSMIDLTPQGGPETELVTDTADVHMFSGGGDAVFYIVSTAEQASTTQVDISGVISGFECMEVTVLGVADGQPRGSTSSRAQVETRETDTVYRDGVLTADLSPGEIMQVVIRGVVPGEDFAEAPDPAIEDEGDLFDPVAEPIPEEDTPDESNSPADEGDGDGGGGGGGFLMGLAPLLILMAMAGGG